MGRKVEREMRSDSYSSESWYKDCVDTDDMDFDEPGRIFKGTTRTVTKYCYKYDKGMGKDFKQDILIRSITAISMNIMKKSLAGLSTIIEATLKRRLRLNARY